MSRIMLHGNAPWIPTAYGQQLALLGRQLRSLGHDVAYSANWGLFGQGLNWKGFQVFPAADGNNGAGCSLLPAHASAWRADLVVALGDAWYWPTEIMAKLGDRLALWMPVDCEPLGAMDHKALRELPGAHPLAMSTHGVAMLESAGLDATYIPHAYDPTVYRPQPGLRDQHRGALGIAPDVFAIGLCAANKDGMRKGFSEQFRAFADFHARHENSRLLVHTVPDKSLGGIDLLALAGLLGISDAVKFPSKYALDAGLYSNEAMASWFNSLDVLSSCSWGEGFCVPLIEAQACGTPAISTQFAAQAQLPARWRVPADRWLIAAHNAWWGRPDVGAIERAYEDAFHQWQSGTDLRTEAAAGVVEYQANTVTEQYWAPFLKSVLPGQGDAA